MTGWWYTCPAPLKNISSSVGMMTFPIWKVIKVMFQITKMIATPGQNQWNKAGVAMGGCRTTGQAAPSRASKTCRTFRDNLHSGCRHRLDHLVTRPPSLLWGDLRHHHHKSDISYISFIFMTINPISLNHPHNLHKHHIIKILYKPDNHHHSQIPIIAIPSSSVDPMGHMAPC